MEADGLQQVLRMRTAVEMGPASYQLASFVHSPAFLYLLSELTPTCKGRATQLCGVRCIWKCTLTATLRTKPA
jgi:hypothetical protein